MFPRGLAEGTKTVAAHGLFVVLPGAMAGMAWAFATVVAITAVQRISFAMGGCGHRPEITVAAVPCGAG